MVTLVVRRKMRMRRRIKVLRWARDAGTNPLLEYRCGVHLQLSKGLVAVRNST